jgi:hypothetical protein
MERRFSEKNHCYYIFDPKTGKSVWEDDHKTTNSSIDVAADSPWEKRYSKTHERYYWFNPVTGKSEWNCPVSISKGNGKSSSRKRQREESEVDGGVTNSTTASSSSSCNTDSPNDCNEALKVGIIVPFRDIHESQKRKAHLDRFCPYMVKFMNEIRPKVGFKIYIIEQSNDGRKFNRGKLLNIGFDIARKDGVSVFIFHDVDLLPSRELGASYSTLPLDNQPVHIAKLWNRYNNDPDYIGGIVAFSRKQFESFNGFPNNYWGWGGEDNEMGNRLKKVGLTPCKPECGGTIEDLEDMSLDQKLKFLKSHREWKCQKKWELLDEHEATWASNGLSDLAYNVVEKNEVGHFPPNECEMMVVDVQLNPEHWSNAECGLQHKIHF